MDRDGTARIALGIVPAVLLRLWGGSTADFSDDELLVVDAMRRSNSRLSDASIEDLAQHVQAMSADQLAGFKNNVKGIYHELKFVERENRDGDDVETRIYEVTNHPGADVRLVNRATGEVTDIQLKATNSSGHVGEHQDRFPSIDVYPTEETANRMDGVESSGFENADLGDETDDVIAGLESDPDYVAESAGAGALLSAARNAKAVLRGERSASSATRKVLEDLGIGASAAGISEILIG